MPTPRTATTRRSSRRPAVPVPVPSPTPDVDAPASENSTAVLQRSAIDQESRRAMIATAAYFRAEKRDFVPGGELDDWIRAEAEIDSLLRL